MIGRNRARSSSLFLLELIIAILFFSIASAVCVQLFVKSHTLNVDAREMDFAVNQCSSMGEIIGSCNTKAEISKKINTIYPDGLYFNADFSPCKKSKAEYKVILDTIEDGSMLKADIKVKSHGKILYRLSMIQNLQREVQ